MLNNYGYAPTYKKDKTEIYKRAAVYQKLAELSETNSTRTDARGNKIEPTKIGYGGYEVLGSRQKDSNFKAATYTNGKEIVISFVGTNPTIGKDQIANGAMIAHKTSRQQKQALDYYNEVKKNNPNAKIVLVGHSEAGSEVQYILGQTGDNVEGFTYNAHGAKRFVDSDKRDKTYDNIHNFRTKDDIVSKYGEHIGQTYIVPLVSNDRIDQGKFDMQTAHKLVNMDLTGDIYTLEEYKAMNPNFFDSVKKLYLSDEAVGKMTSAEFLNLEGMVMDLMVDNRLQPQSTLGQYAASGELVEVTAYTKDDGTEVKGYTRKRPLH